MLCQQFKDEGRHSFTIVVAMKGNIWHNKHEKTNTQTEITNKLCSNLHVCHLVIYTIAKSNGYFHKNTIVNIDYTLLSDIIGSFLVIICHACQNLGHPI